MIEVYATTYCNKGHRVKDGVPIDHECRVLPPEALEAEMRGDYHRAIEILENEKNPRMMRRGVRAYVEPSPESLGMLKAGLESAKRGEMKDLGSFVHWTLEVGDLVNYNGASWIINKILDDKAELQALGRGRIEADLKDLVFVDR